MATSTIFISDMFIPLLTIIFSFLGAISGGYIVWKLNNNNERYKKLYGPLKFHLLMMRLMVRNRDEVFNDIKEWLNVETRISLMHIVLGICSKRIPG
jgi:hypothetical protein